jgi:hypothetical protein
MPPTYADCPDCGYECKVDDDPAAQPIVCPKCNKIFTVELGETYGVAGVTPSGPASPDQVVPDTAEFAPDESEPQPGKSWLEAWPQD